MLEGLHAAEGSLADSLGVVGDGYLAEDDVVGGLASAAQRHRRLATHAPILVAEHRANGVYRYGRRLGAGKRGDRLPAQVRIFRTEHVDQPRHAWLSGAREQLAVVTAHRCRSGLDLVHDAQDGRGQIPSGYLG